MEITISPLPTNWGKEKLHQSYTEIADFPQVSRVYVGEISCHKRNILDKELFLVIRDVLKRAGKEVIFSSHVLSTNREDILKDLSLAELADGIEVNNIGLLNVWKKQFSHMPLTIGQFLNAYNRPVVDYYSSEGAERIVLPVDMSRRTIPHITKQKSFKVEMFVYGHLPIGFSFRCYTARAFGKVTKNCGHKCYSTLAMPLHTLDDEPIYLINGPALFSTKTYCLLPYIDDLQNMGVDALRVEPAFDEVSNSLDTVIRIIEGKLSFEQGEKELIPYSPHGLDTRLCLEYF